MKFKELNIGDVFRFTSEDEYLGMARGPWKKTSARKYERVEDGMKCKVGTVNVEVRKEAL